MIRRRVFIKLKDGLAPERVSDMQAKFLAMPARIPGIVRCHFGRNESWDHQFDFIWEVEFRSRRDLDAYTDHPYHDILRALFPNPHPAAGPIRTEDDGSKPTCIVQRFAMVDYTVEDD